MRPEEVRLYTDEDVHGKLAPALRDMGYDAVSANEDARLSFSDMAVLLHCIEHDRILFTYNVVDFAPLHHQWVEDGKEHPGMIFSQHYYSSIGQLIRDMSRLLSGADRDVLRSNTLWL